MMGGGTRRRVADLMHGALFAARGSGTHTPLLLLAAGAVDMPPGGRAC
jgi:hypothetical protein